MKGQPIEMMSVKTAVKAIIRDLSSRKGLSSEWEQIDEDIREEIRYEWEIIVGKHTRAQKENDDG